MKYEKSPLYEIYGEKSGEKSENTTIAEDGLEISIPNRIDVYIGLSITPKDRYIVKVPSQISSVVKSSVLLQNDDDELCGEFELKESLNSGEYFLTANAKNLDLENHSNVNYKLVFQSGGRKWYKKIQVYVNRLEETSTCLCIDFGTSNTTAGCFLTHDYISNISTQAVYTGNVVTEEMNIVTFDQLGNGEYNSRLVPTMAYVDGCYPNGSVEYLFGYSAIKRVADEKYCPQADYFMELKRWVTDYNEKITILDSDGVTKDVLKRDIIKEYLLYIIGESEQQFKCKFRNLHISAPVKLKNEYIYAFREILGELGYNVEEKNAIDEGIAVLYNVINDDIQEKKKATSTTNCGHKKILIIDCGGGTSDLASCEYNFSIDDGITDLTIKTSYLDGDVNFGGNNLTYRIMQFMKIVFAYYYKSDSAKKKRKKDKRFLLESVLEKNAKDIVSYIEEGKNNQEEIAERKKEIYEKFEEKYIEAEEIIPTRFKDYESSTNQVYRSVKNNFYFLWNLADQMKKQFYQYDSISRYTIKKEDSKKDDSDRDSDLYIKDIKEWSLSVKEDGVLKDTQSFSEIIFNAKEIAWLLQGDIYYLVHKFFSPLYKFTDSDIDRLGEYDNIKLSGQSTNIDTFKNSLKEFLAGIKINSYRRNEDPTELKLACVKGAIQYIHALESSQLEVDLTNETLNIPVDVIAKNNGTCLINRKDGWNQEPKYIRITTSAKNIEFELCSSETTIQKPYHYECANLVLKPAKMFEIAKATNNLVNDTVLDNLPLNKRVAVVYVNQLRWGFNIIAIEAMDDGTYNASEPSFCSFDAKIAQKTFFNGEC